MGSAWANIAVDLVNVTQTVHRLLDTLGNPSVRPEHVVAVTTTIERMQRCVANMEVERRALLVVANLPPGHPGYSGQLARPGKVRGGVAGEGAGSSVSHPLFLRPCLAAQASCFAYER